MVGMMKVQAPPGQACFSKIFSGGKVRILRDQLVILVGMNPVSKFKRIIARKQDRGKRFRHQFYQPGMSFADTINAGKACQ
jgi:hypothetical protein